MKISKHGGYLSFRYETYMFDGVLMLQPERAMTTLFNTTASFVNCTILLDPSTFLPALFHYRLA